MSFNKRNIASILTALMIINIFAVFLMPQEVYGTNAAWQELRAAKEGNVAFNINGDIIYVNKVKDNEFTISHRGSNGEWNDKITKLPEIKSGYRLGDTVYLPTSKDGKVTIYKSSDGGSSWNTMTYSQNIGTNKIEGIYVIDEQNIYITDDKAGIFHYGFKDDEHRWEKINGNLPVPNASKPQEFDTRPIALFNNRLYVGTKKNGVFVSDNNGGSWAPVKNASGLTTDAKDIWDIIVIGDILYIGTKDGVWRTDLTTEAAFTKVSGLSGEVRRLMVIEGRLYSITKDKKIYLMKSGIFEVFNNQTSTSSEIGDFVSLDNFNGYFYVAHKKGLLQIEDAFKPIDKTTLLSTIVAAQAKVAAAVEGDGVGQYPVGSKAELAAGIDVAFVIYNDEASTEETINLALNILSNAVATFEASKNPDAWHQLSSEESNHILFVNGKMLLVTKNTVLLSREGGWDAKLNGIKEIGATYAYGASIYLIGNNDENKVFYKSTNNGESFTNMFDNGKTLPSGIGENKIEGLYVEEDGKLYIVAEKKGVYYSSNDGGTWTQINNASLPTNSEPRQIWKYDGKFYVSTKKQGVYESADGVAWTLVKNGQGLSSEKEKEIADLLKAGDMLYAATKDGIYCTNITDSNGWTKVSGVSGEARGLTQANGKIYAIIKESKIYYLDNTSTFRVFVNQPSGVSLEEFRSFTFDGDAFLVAGKKGLLRIIDDYKEMNLATIAASITSLANPIVNATSLALPVLPAGYNIEIIHTSNEDILDLEGNLTLKDVSQTVTLRFEITKLEDLTTAQTPDITITIPAKVAVGDKDGVYIGVGKGKNGDIKVSVTLAGGKIVSIEVLEHKESVTHATYAVPVSKALYTDLPQSIIASQSVDVDTITNATATSNGMKKAILDALKETSYYEPIETDWKSYNIGSKEGVEVFAVNGKYIYVTKKDKKSDIHLVSYSGEFVTKLSNISEIDTGYRVPNTNTIYLIGRKEGNALFVSNDGGESWSTPITTQGIGSEKIESLLVINPNEMYISVSKFGLYKSTDGGSNWELFNSNLPKNPEKNTEYDTRKIWNINNKWYIGTKKQGLLTSVDGLNWTAFKSTGLSSEGKDVWDILIKDNVVFMSTKAGVWGTNLNDSTPWVKIAGFSVEGRKIVNIDGRVYAFAKNGNSYYLDVDTFKIMLATPSGVSIDDVRGLAYSNGYFILANKEGLIRMRDILKPEEETDTDTYASPDYDPDPVPLPVIAQYNKNVKIENIKLEKSNEGSISGKITKDNISKLLKENTGVKTVELTVTEGFNSLVMNLEGEGFKELKEKNISIITTFQQGSYTIPVGLKALEEAAVGKGELVSLILKIDKITANLPDNHQLLVQPVKFTLEAEFTGGIVEVNSFGKQFVERRLLVPNTINVKKSTGIVYEDGVWRAVPTTFITEAGKTYAIIKRNSNSIYSVMESEVSFKDISEHWSQDIVEILASKKILQGSEGSYLPEGILTRAQFITMLVRSLGLKTVNSKATTFKDVEAGSWYEAYVYTAVDFGIVQGNSDGTFKPDKEISREEMVVMVMRAIDIVKELEIKDSEATTISKWLDGEYVASGTGFRSSIQVKVVIKNGNIQSINILENGDSLGVGDVAAAGMANRIVSQQSTAVDTYTGATASSKGLLEAVNRALDTAKNPESTVATEGQLPVKANVMFKDDAKISPWAFEAVYKAVADSIVGGYEDVTFRPHNTSKRSEAAVVILRMLEALDFISR